MKSQVRRAGMTGKNVFWFGLPLLVASSVCLWLASPQTVGAAYVGSLALLFHFDRLNPITHITPDSSGNDNDGTVNSATQVPGKYRKALSFDGADDFVSVAHSATLDFTSAYTLEGWVEVTDVADYRPIFFRTNGTADEIEVYVQKSTNDLVVFHNRNNAGAFNCVLYPPPPIGRLFHLGVTFNSAGGGSTNNGFNAYYDGLPQTPDASQAGQCAGSAVNGPPLATGFGWWIGKTGGFGTHFFSGTMDEVRFWSRALGANEILADAQAGLRLDMHFDEPASPAPTSFADSSGYGNNGAPSAGAPTVVPGMPHFGNALSFDGTDDFVTILNSPSLNPPKAITVEAWVFPTATGFFPSIVNKGNVGNFAESYDLFVWSDGSPALLVNNNGTSSGRAIAKGPTPLTLNTWTHLAGTYDGANVKIYVNGALVATTPESGNINPTPDNVLIGKADRTSGAGSSFPDSFFSGEIDEVHVWARALSDAEIAYIANATTKGELVLPSKIGQRIEPLIGATVYPTVYDVEDLDRAMGLDFIVSGESGTTIDPFDAPPPKGHFGCVTDKGSGSEDEDEVKLGGLLGCVNGLTGKSALFTAKQFNLEKVLHHDDDEIELSSFIELTLNTTEVEGLIKDRDHLRFHLHWLP